MITKTPEELGNFAKNQMEQEEFLYYPGVSSGFGELFHSSVMEIGT